MPDENSPVIASFRDPSGFLFKRDGALYRQVNQIYKDDYDIFIGSGLYNDLVLKGLLINHEEVDVPPYQSDTCYKILYPEYVPFISYPYEWCFSQLKDAALTTLSIQRYAIEKDMSLKDANAYNIQFLKGRPVLIDTLSFERYLPGKPWVAYRQFCQHFLAPLALMSHVDIRLGQLARVYLDGVPLDLASRLLPKWTVFNFSLSIHIHLHAQSQHRYAGKQIDKSKLKRTISKRSLLGFLDSLQTTIKRLKWRSRQTEWGEYYEETNYSEDALKHKKYLVEQFTALTNAESAWDFGANTGLFSRILTAKGIPTIAFDIDPIAVEKNYRDSFVLKDEFMLPLLLDLANPSPSNGWMNEERDNIFARGPRDLALALALVHHLAISNNLPFSLIARFFKNVCRWLIIEFVPKSDSQVQRLLMTRDDIFVNYTQQDFENALNLHFKLVQFEPIRDSKRILYLWKCR